MNTYINTTHPPIFHINDIHKYKTPSIFLVKSRWDFDAAQNEFAGVVKKLVECLAQRRIDAYKTPYDKEKRRSINKSTSTDKYLQYWLDSTNAELFALGGELALYQEAADNAVDALYFAFNPAEADYVINGYNKRNAAITTYIQMHSSLPEP